MTNLLSLSVTPSHLTATQQDLVALLRENSCAFRIRGGWQTKRNRKQFRARTCDGLIARQIAMVQHGRGPDRLVLTPQGEDMATAILDQRRRRKS